jgi:predicted nucleic acid-binding protein
VTIVVDASTVVAALVDVGSDGDWAQASLRGEDLLAPHLMPVEAANILRRAVLSGGLSADVATLAHDDLRALRVDLFPYEPLASRVWELRYNLTAYDGCYVALAEAVGAPLVTLDARIAQAPGLRCQVRQPPPA